MSKAYIEVFRHISDKQVEYVNTIACKTKPLVRDGVIYWSDYIGEIFDYCYMGIRGQFTVLNYDNKTSVFTLRFDKYDLNHTIGLKPFKKASFMNIFKIRYHRLKIDDVYANKRIVGISYDVQNRSIVYEYQCLTDGYVGKALECNLLRSTDRCPVCLGDVIIEGINDIPTTEPWMVKYFIGGRDEAKRYTRTSNQRIVFQCPDCKTKKLMHVFDLHRNNGMHCQCSHSTSYPEKFLMRFLDELGVKYVHQCSSVVLPWITNRYMYDFYLPDYSMIIETHGGQHYKKYKNSAWSATLEDIQQRDRDKELLAKQNGVQHYVVLDCRKSNTDWIERSIRNSRLDEIFDLDRLDWHKVHNNAHGNIRKEVCFYVNEHPNETHKEVAEKFHIHYQTVNQYLRYGKQYGWVA